MNITFLNNNYDNLSKKFYNVENKKNQLTIQINLQTYKARTVFFILYFPYLRLIKKVPE